jgi:hypothetical protein
VDVPVARSAGQHQERRAALAPQRAAGPGAPGKTYLYRLTETTTFETKPVLSVDAPSDDVPPGLIEAMAGARPTAKVECVWDVGLQLAETRADGSVLASLLPVRRRGTRMSFDGEPKRFDSDDPRSPSSRFVGRTIRVELSSTGRLLGAEFLHLPPTPGVTVEVLDPGMAKVFAARFFQELPAAPPRVGLEWEAKRDAGVESVDTVGFADVQRLGEFIDKLVLRRAAGHVLGASLISRGKPKGVPSKAPEKPVDFEQLRSVVTKLEDWLVTGEVEINRATGLLRARTTTSHFVLHRPAIDLSALKDKLPNDTSSFSPAVDATYDVTSKLEAVEGL